jgi:hypothetical protein
MPYRVEEVRFITDPVRLTLVEFEVVSMFGFRKESVLIDSAGVGGPDDSVEAGVTSKTRLGRGRRIRGCSAMVIGLGGWCGVGASVFVGFLGESAPIVGAAELGR